MSYDLYLKLRVGQFSRRQFTDYFAKRPRFQVQGSQAIYSNDETGVHFLAEHNEPSDEPDGEYYPVSININYVRPSYFVLEAEPEITALVRKFDMLALDPQMDGMGEGEYAVPALHSGWNCGNEFGYRAILGRPGELARRHLLPTAKLQAAWRWNFQRAGLQGTFGEDKFVPRIFFANVRGKVATLSVWTDGIPSCIPPTDYVVVYRQKLAPWRFFRRVPDMALVRWSEIAALLRTHGRKNDDGSHTLGYTDPPREVVKHLKGLAPTTDELAMVPSDSVLDQEIAERAAAGEQPGSE